MQRFPREQHALHRTWAFAKSQNAAMREKMTQHLTFDPMSLDTLTATPHFGRGAVYSDRRPLDRIDKNIVAKVNMVPVLRRADAVVADGRARGEEAEWAERLRVYFEHGFPRRTLPPDSPDAPRRLARRLTGNAQATAQDLFDAGVLLESQARHDRTFASLFQVPKNEKVDRAIVNCKSINNGFEKPPPLSLAEIGTLLGLANFFEDATFATADIRHFFWQLRMPPMDRRWFSVSADVRGQSAAKNTGMLECNALPMGWSWSPWVAQAIAGLAVAEAGARLGAQKNTPGAHAEPVQGATKASPPPFWYIRDGRGDAKAIVVIWYDNFLVIAPRAADDGVDWCKEVRKQLDVAMKCFKIQWKTNAFGQPWDVRDNEADYIGIRFYREDRVFSWRHIDENIEAWKQAKVSRYPLLAEVAQILGFITWDAHVRLGRRMSSPIRRLMSRVGATYHHLHEAGANKRAKDAHILTLTDDEQRALRTHLDELLLNVPIRAPQAFITEIRLLASDATPTCAAGVLLDDGPASTTFDAAIRPFVNRSAHINCIETLAALETVKWAMQRQPEATGVLYAIAVDNTTAVSWFNGRTALDEQVQAELEALEAQLQERRSSTWAWWEPTATQPADEVSKKQPLNAAKVRTCKDRLEANARVDLTALRIPRYRTTECE